MQVLAQLSPSHWTALETLFAVMLLLAVLAAVGGLLLRRVLRKDEEQNRIDAEQIAVAGKMVARSPEDGDRLSLKERNSIKVLIGEAVLALREQGRRAIETLKAADAALAIECVRRCGRGETGGGRSRRAQGRRGASPSSSRFRAIHSARSPSSSKLSSLILVMHRICSPLPWCSSGSATFPMSKR
jgi:hypothetical protein